MSSQSCDKMISFRLSERDYKRLREIRVSQGARSISELARAAISQLVSTLRPTSDEVLEVRVSELEGQIRELALELEKVKRAS